VYARHPELFLAPWALGRALVALGEPALVIALRGGEPSRHPGLAVLARVASHYARAVYVETHARWAIEPTPLLPALAAAGAIVKISFDAMHGMRPVQLQRVVAALERAGVAWLVAITEPDDAAFARTRASCGFIADERIVVQRKVTAHHLLFAPRLGTIDVTGERTVRPTARLAFRVVSDHAG